MDRGKRMCWEPGFEVARHQDATDALSRSERAPVSRPTSVDEEGGSRQSSRQSTPPRAHTPSHTATETERRRLRPTGSVHRVQTARVVTRLSESELRSTLTGTTVEGGSLRPYADVRRGRSTRFATVTETRKRGFRAVASAAEAAVAFRSRRRPAE